MDWNPTESCKKAAEILMNGEERIKTGYGEKTVLGVADLIYREAGIMDLAEVCELVVETGQKCFADILKLGHIQPKNGSAYRQAKLKAKSAILKIAGEE